MATGTTGASLAYADIRSGRNNDTGQAERAVEHNGRGIRRGRGEGCRLKWRVTERWGSLVPNLQDEAALRPTRQWQSILHGRNRVEPVAQVPRGRGNRSIRKPGSDGLVDSSWIFWRLADFRHRERRWGLEQLSAEQPLDVQRPAAERPGAA